MSNEPTNPSPESHDRSALALGLVVHAALAAAGLCALLLLGVPPSYGVGFAFVLLAAGTAGAALLFQLVRRSSAERTAARPGLGSQLRATRSAAVGELACSIAQGLRAPVARLSSLLAGTAGGGPIGAPTSAVLTEARAAARQLEAALRDLCEFVGPDGREPVSCDLERLVRTTLALVDGELRHRCDVRVLLELLPPAVVHPRLVQHALAAALVVAAHSLPRRGSLEISARREEGDIALRLEAVPGDGPAIPSGTREVRTLELSLCEELLAGTGGSLHSIRSPQGGLAATLLLPAGEEVARAA